MDIEILIKRKFKSARKGLSDWKKIEKQLGFGKKDVMVFQPDGYSDDAVFSITCIHQLQLTYDPEHIYIVTTNPDMAKIVPLFHGDAAVHIVDEKTSFDMMNYVLMAKMEKNIFVASLTEPFGRWGDKFVRYGDVSAEHCFAKGVYRVWHYEQEVLPDYAGNDKAILDFLSRAKQLQEGGWLKDE